MAVVGMTNVVVVLTLAFPVAQGAPVGKYVLCKMFFYQSVKLVSCQHYHATTPVSG